MIIQNLKKALDIKIRESILTKVSTVKFLSVTLDENLTFKDHVNKVTSKISKSVGGMKRLHCQLPANVMVKLYYSNLVYSHLIYGLLAWGRSGRTNAVLRLSVITGEHANYSQIITKRSTLFTCGIRHIAYIFILYIFLTLFIINFSSHFIKLILEFILQILI